MRKMHLRSGLLKSVDRPVPAIRRLEDDFGILTAPGDHTVKPVDIVEDLDRLQHLTRESVIRTTTLRRRCRSIPRTAALRTLSSGASFVVDVSTPQHPPETHKERRPRSFIASEAVYVLPVITHTAAAAFPFEARVCGRTGCGCDLARSQPTAPAER